MLLFMWVGYVCAACILHTLTITNEHQAQLHQKLKFIQTLSSDRTIHTRRGRESQNIISS